VKVGLGGLTQILLRSTHIPRTVLVRFMYGLSHAVRGEPKDDPMFDGSLTDEKLDSKTNLKRNPQNLEVSSAPSGPIMLRHRSYRWLLPCDPSVLTTIPS
jgi:hypothetical protein